MAFKLLVLAVTLTYASAGLIGAPAAVATYSSAPAVSSSYFHQASAPVAVAHAAPVGYAAQHAPIAYAAQHAPVAYAAQHAPVAYAAQAIHAPSVGVTQESVARSLGGAQSVSTFSKAVDSAFSSVRKFDTRVTNDALALAPAQVAYSSPLITKAYAQPAPQLAYAAHAAPITYSSPVVAKTYAAGSLVSSYAAPLVAKAPIAAYAAQAPQLAYAAHSAPVAYSSPVIAKTYAAAPVAYSAPVVAKSYGAPVAAYAAQAPVLTKTAVAYSPASVVAHTTFQGLGVEYHY